jgi:hypothetical protein
LDVAGAYSKWALNISGPNSDWAWQLGFELGLDGGLGPDLRVFYRFAPTFQLLC